MKKYIRDPIDHKECVGDKPGDRTATSCKIRFYRQDFCAIIKKIVPVSFNFRKTVLHTGTYAVVFYTNHIEGDFTYEKQGKTRDLFL